MVLHHLKRLAHYCNEQVHEYHEDYESSQDKKDPRELVVWAKSKIFKVKFSKHQKVHIYHRVKDTVVVKGVKICKFLISPIRGIFSAFRVGVVVVSVVVDCEEEI